MVEYGVGWGGGVVEYGVRWGGGEVECGVRSGGEGIKNEHCQTKRSN